MALVILSRGQRKLMADNRAIFLVDCDGPLADLPSIWYERHNRTCTVCSKPLTIDMVHDWYLHQFVECGKDVYKYLDDPTIWRDVRPHRNAQRILRRMTSYVRPVVVTTVTSGLQARLYRIQWIRKHFPYINPLDIVITDKKSCVNGDILLDDAPHNLADHTAHRLVLDYPWNRNFSDALRVFNWEDVEACVREYLELGVPDGRLRRSLRPG